MPQTSYRAVAGGQNPKQRIRNIPPPETKIKSGKVAKMKKITKFAFRLVKGVLLLPFHIACPTFGLTDAEKAEMGIKTSR